MSWRRRLFVLGLCVGVPLFMRQVWISYRAIQQHNVDFVEPVYLLAALGATLVVYLFQMLAWFMIMRYLGVPLRLRDTLQGFYLSFLPRYIPGSVWGYWSRSQWLEQSYSVDYALSVMGSILEATALVLTGLFVTGGYLCLQETGSTRLLLALACASLLGLTWLFVPRLAMRLGRRFYPDGRLATPRYDHLVWTWSAALVLYLALWIAFGSAVLLTGKAIARGSSPDLFVSTFAASLSWVVGFLVVFVPTGIGVREVVLSTLLSSYGQLSPWQADLAAVITRFGIIFAELIWLLVGLGLYMRKWRDHRDRLGNFPRLRQK